MLLWERYKDDDAKKEEEPTDSPKILDGEKQRAKQMIELNYSISLSSLLFCNPRKKILQTHT
jgi:hypothetical protein